MAACSGVEYDGLQAHVNTAGGQRLQIPRQLRDAADSAQRNFPEGFGRLAPGDVAHFLDHSRASLLEVKNELAAGLERGYFTQSDVADATLLADRALKALSGLQRYLRSPQAKLNAQTARAAFIARRRANSRT